LLAAVAFGVSDVQRARAGEIDVPEGAAAAAKLPIEPNALGLPPIAKGTRTLYVFNGARHYDMATAIGAMTATSCTHLGPLPAGVTSVPIVYEFYNVFGALAGSATDGIIAAGNMTSINCTSVSGTGPRISCSSVIPGLPSTLLGTGFIRVVVPVKNASRILCTAEIVSGTDGGGANIVDRLIGVRKGALVIPPDTYIP
jgi:hypothetical protein